MRRFIDGVLGVGDPAFTVTNLAADKVASGLQLFQRRADGVHSLLADGGKPAGGVVPLVCQGEHLGQQTDGFQRQTGVPQVVIGHSFGVE